MPPCGLLLFPMLLCSVSLRVHFGMLGNTPGPAPLLAPPLISVRLLWFREMTLASVLCWDALYGLDCVLSVRCGASFLFFVCSQVFWFRWSTAKSTVKCRERLISLKSATNKPGGTALLWRDRTKVFSERMFRG